MVTTADPVATGLIDSLARPGVNVTGITRLTRELSGKRLELLKEALPRMSRVGVLWNANATVCEGLRDCGGRVKVADSTVRGQRFEAVFRAPNVLARADRVIR